MTTISREEAIKKVMQHYPQARQQLEASGLFGKELDRKARKLAVKMAGVKIPDGLTVAWATPDDWGKDGYRNPGRPSELESGRRVNVYLDAASIERASSIGAGNVSEGIRIALQRFQG